VTPGCFWTTASRPAELQIHWEGEYPKIDTASSKIGILEKYGYSPRAYFVLPDYCWRDNYYKPLQGSFSDFFDRNGNSEDARVIVQAEEREIDLYEKYGAYYGYGMYIAQKGGLPAA
jgi:hypothetical protein